MDQQALIKLAIAGGILFAAYKFGPGWVKAMALGVGGVVVANQIPPLRAAMA